MNNDRLSRLAIGAICTGASYFAGGKLLPPFTPLKCLWLAAALAYFLILCFWVKNGRAPKSLMLAGTLLGTLSTITLGIDFIFALPAIALMFYILILSFENFSKDWLFRLMIAIVCTGTSYTALLLPLATPFIMPLLPYHPINYLWIAAWAAYFSILYFWIKSNRAPKLLMVVGTILGTLSVLSTMGWALIFALPAIVLMVYVLLLSFQDLQSAPQ